MRGAAAYARIDQFSRVEGATPHGLVAILLEEAAGHIATLEAAYARGLRAHAAQARAQGILHALEASLDFRAGGETAVLMARVYREARRCLSRAADEIDPFWCKQARATLDPIADAWAQIAQAA